MRDMNDAYFVLLKDCAFNSDTEEALLAAADFGRSLLRHGLAPERVIEIHQTAVLRLAKENPLLLLADVAQAMTAPLMEVSMAYMLAFHRDRDRTNILEAQVSRAGRLEAVGTMAAGIAHDFNTILGIVNGYAELLIEDFSDNADALEYAQQIVTATGRARGLIQRMLAFARQTPVAPVRVDAVALARNLLKMIRLALPSGIYLNFTHEPETAWVVADPLQIEQIVMNLCMNAADAMEGSGKLDIDIRHAPSLASAGEDKKLHPHFTIAIDDDGCGMSPEVQQRALDPFFTTKEPGKGSGLGLSVVYGIVRDLGGRLIIHSEVGSGSSVQISLPLNVAGEPDILAPSTII